LILLEDVFKILALVHLNIKAGVLIGAMDTDRVGAAFADGDFLRQTIRFDGTVRWYGSMVRFDGTVRWYGSMIKVTRFGCWQVRRNCNSWALMSASQ